MNSTIFLPNKINVGFQERSSTYTGKLAYVIYYDQKGVLRKENSWNSWRDEAIPNEEYENVPTEGFVLNKKVGGYDTGWNHRQTYTRVYDPRGFEFEITVENLLYILENTSSIKGKGLEGEFIYGWDGKDLLLIPCDSPDYKELKEYNEKLKNKVNLKGKDLILGATYLSKENNKIVYLGRYEYYDWRNNADGKQYFFYNKDLNIFESYKTVGNAIIDVVSEECIQEYSEIFSKFEYNEYYNPYDKSKDEYIYHTLDSFKKYTENQMAKIPEWRNYINVYYYQNFGEESKNINRDMFSRGWSSRTCSEPYINIQKTGKFEWYNPKTVSRAYWGRIEEVIEAELELIDVEEAFKRLKPQYKKEYLKDGKLRKVKNYE